MTNLLVRNDTSRTSRACASLPIVNIMETIGYLTSFQDKRVKYKKFRYSVAWLLILPKALTIFSFSRTKVYLYKCCVANVNMYHNRVDHGRFMNHKQGDMEILSLWSSLSSSGKPQTITNYPSILAPYCPFEINYWIFIAGTLIIRARGIWILHNR